MQPATRRTFRKTERLSSRKAMEELIRDGKSSTVSLFRLIWNPCELNTSFPAQIAFSVPKKRFRKAVDRNKIRRKMREVYRKNKHDIYALLESSGKRYALLLIFTGKTIPVYSEVEEQMTKVFGKFTDANKKNPG